MDNIRTIMGYEENGTVVQGRNIYADDKEKRIKQK